ncbi:hypothetical protein ACTQ50_06050 [Blautia sp. Sow4_E7]
MQIAGMIFQTGSSTAKNSHKKKLPLKDSFSPFAPFALPDSLYPRA